MKANRSPNRRQYGCIWSSREEALRGLPSRYVGPKNGLRLYNEFEFWNAPAISCYHVCIQLRRSYFIPCCKSEITTPRSGKDHYPWLNRLVSSFFGLRLVTHSNSLVFVSRREAIEKKMYFMVTTARRTSISKWTWQYLFEWLCEGSATTHTLTSGELCICQVSQYTTLGSNNSIKSIRISSLATWFQVCIDGMLFL